MKYLPQVKYPHLFAWKCVFNDGRTLMNRADDQKCNSWDEAVARINRYHPYKEARIILYFNPYFWLVCDIVD